MLLPRPEIRSNFNGAAALLDARVHEITDDMFRDARQVIHERHHPVARRPPARFGRPPLFTCSFMSLFKIIPPGSAPAYTGNAGRTPRSSPCSPTAGHHLRRLVQLQPVRDQQDPRNAPKISPCKTAGTPPRVGAEPLYVMKRLRRAPLVADRRNLVAANAAAPALPWLHAPLPARTHDRAGGPPPRPTSSVPTTLRILLCCLRLRWPGRPRATGPYSISSGSCLRAWRTGFLPRVAPAAQVLARPFAPPGRCGTPCGSARGRRGEGCRGVVEASFSGSCRRSGLWSRRSAWGSDSRRPMPWGLPVRPPGRQSMPSAQ